MDPSRPPHLPAIPAALQQQARRTHLPLLPCIGAAITALGNTDYSIRLDDYLIAGCSFRNRNFTRTRYPRKLSPIGNQLAISGISTLLILRSRFWQGPVRRRPCASLADRRICKSKSSVLPHRACLPIRLSVTAILRHARQCRSRGGRSCSPRVLLLATVHRLDGQADEVPACLQGAMKRIYSSHGTS